MKINKSHIEQVIKEEVEKILQEGEMEQDPEQELYRLREEASEWEHWRAEAEKQLKAAPKKPKSKPSEWEHWRAEAEKQLKAAPAQNTKKKPTWRQILARKAQIQNRLSRKINLSIKDVQKAVGAPVTGEYDAATYRAIRAKQKELFPKSRKEWDGLFGGRTQRALAARGAAKPAVPDVAKKKTEPTYKSIEQLKKEMDAAQSQATMVHQGGFAKSVKAAAMKNWLRARTALQQAQALEKSAEDTAIAAVRSGKTVDQAVAAAANKGKDKRNVASRKSRR